MPLNPQLPRCAAKARHAADGQCKNTPMRGVKVCRMHGGASPQVKAKLARQDLEAKLNRIVQKLHIVPVDDPLTELQKLAGEALAWKDEMRRHVGKLTELRYKTESEQVRAEVALYERAIERLGNLLIGIAKLNIDERLAAITEQQAEMHQRAMFAAMEAAGLTIDDADTKRKIAAAYGRHLSIVQAG